VLLWLFYFVSWSQVCGWFLHSVVDGLMLALLFQLNGSFVCFRAVSWGTLPIFMIITRKCWKIMWVIFIISNIFIVHVVNHGTGILVSISGTFPDSSWKFFCWHIGNSWFGSFKILIVMDFCFSHRNIYMRIEVFGKSSFLALAHLVHLWSL